MEDRMNHQRTLHFIALSFALGATFNAFAVDPTFTAIDFPGATGTQTWGITPRGDIIGNYTLADKTTHGFLLSGDIFTSIDYPGAAVTLAEGINPEGDIVGEYGVTLTSPHHAYVLTRKGEFTSFDYPGATATFGLGINSRGDILGGYVAADNINRGFLLNNGKFTSFEYPGASPIAPGGINGRGDVVGAYTTAGHGFLMSNGTFTSWDVPDAAFTNATGINNRGEIVGRYRDAAGVSHAYLKVGSEYTTFDFPGATFTGATAIKSNGDILGRCTVAGVNHGFLLTRHEVSEPRYTLTDLGVVGVGGYANVMTDNGLIAGGAAAADGALHAVLWYRGLKTDLATPGLGGMNSIAYGINERGEAVGAAEASTADTQGEDFCGFQELGLPAHGSKCLPFLWQSGAMTPLPTLGGNNGFASWINNRGQISGLAENSRVDPTCPAPQKFQFKPVVWENGRIQELPTFGLDTNGFAFSINDNGDVVGTSGDCAGLQNNGTHLLSRHALLWETGKVTDLGTLGGKEGNFAYSINNQGQVVGQSDLPGDETFHAFLWTKQTGMQDLGTLPGDIASSAFGVNAGEVVGLSADPQFNIRAFVWQNGVMSDLNSLVPGDSPLFLLLGLAINANGEIVGNAVDQSTGEIHGFLATPRKGNATH
jgi:probable HAF family extracellular repeat protein